MRVGLLGGTFNPIHKGHLSLAREAIEALKLDKVVFIPAYRPPHKDIDTDASAEDRLAMVKLAVEGNEKFEVSTFELDKKSTSYSIDTVRFFKDCYGKTSEIFFVAGSDSASDLSSWKEIDRIFEMVHFVIATRPGYELKDVPPEVRVLKIASVDVSSKEIRSRVKENRPIDGMVDEKVRRYIADRGIYR